MIIIQYIQESSSTQNQLPQLRLFHLFIAGVFRVFSILRAHVVGPPVFFLAKTENFATDFFSNFRTSQPHGFMIPILIQYKEYICQHGFAWNHNGHLSYASSNSEDANAINVSASWRKITKHFIIMPVVSMCLQRMAIAHNLGLQGFLMLWKCTENPLLRHSACHSLHSAERPSCASLFWMHPSAV